MDSRVAYSLLVGFVAALRVVELRLSNRNIKMLKARGAVEEGASVYPWLVGVHALFLLSCVAEVWVADRPWIPWLGAAMSLVFVCGMALRYWAIRTLGELWSTRVVYVPEDPLVATGPFRWLHHPNYFGVALEILSLPLIHTAWVTAVVFSAAFGWVAHLRIRTENAMLASRERLHDPGPSNVQMDPEQR